MIVVNNLLSEIWWCFSSACIENLSLSQRITSKLPNWMEWPNWGKLIQYKQIGPGTKKKNHLLLHCSDGFIFLIAPPVHEYILMVKNLLNSEVLIANPEMTPPVCFSYFPFPVSNIVKSLTGILLSLPMHLCMCVYLLSNFLTQRESSYYLNLYVYMFVTYTYTCLYKSFFLWAKHNFPIDGPFIVSSFTLIQTIKLWIALNISLDTWESIFWKCISRSRIASLKGFKI